MQHLHSISNHQTTLQHKKVRITNVWKDQNKIPQISARKFLKSSQLTTLDNKQLLHSFLHSHTVKKGKKEGYSTVRKW